VGSNLPLCLWLRYFLTTCIAFRAGSVIVVVGVVMTLEEGKEKDYDEKVNLKTLVDRGFSALSRTHIHDGYKRPRLFILEFTPPTLAKWSSSAVGL
jgi:hypothetical protein